MRKSYQYIIVIGKWVSLVWLGGDGMLTFVSTFNLTRDLSRYVRIPLRSPLDPCFCFHNFSIICLCISLNGFLFYRLCVGPFLLLVNLKINLLFYILYKMNANKLINIYYYLYFFV